MRDEKLVGCGVIQVRRWYRTCMPVVHTRHTYIQATIDKDQKRSIYIILYKLLYSTMVDTTGCVYTCIPSLDLY